METVHGAEALIVGCHHGESAIHKTSHLLVVERLSRSRLGNERVQ